KKLKNLSWEVLPHLPHFPDMAPSDCHLFNNFIQFYTNDEARKTAVATFFNSKPTEFLERGIDHMVKR
ncbi:Histone-lysine N-methyltransferase SETMAR, partial [Habropoda laboriosa]